MGLEIWTFQYLLIRCRRSWLCHSLSMTIHLLQKFLIWCRIWKLNVFGWRPTLVPLATRRRIVLQRQVTPALLVTPVPVTFGTKFGIKFGIEINGCKFQGPQVKVKKRRRRRKKKFYYGNVVVPIFILCTILTIQLKFHSFSLKSKMCHSSILFVIKSALVWPTIIKRACILLRIEAPMLTQMYYLERLYEIRRGLEYMYK